MASDQKRKPEEIVDDLARKRRATETDAPHVLNVTISDTKIGESSEIVMNKYVYGPEVSASQPSSSKNEKNELKELFKTTKDKFSQVGPCSRSGVYK